MGRYSLTVSVVVFFGSTLRRKRWNDAELSAGVTSSVSFQPARAGMLDDHRPRGRVAVADGVSVLLPLLGHLRHGAVRDDHFGDALAVGLLFAVNQNAEIGGVGEQALLAGLDRVHQAFAGKGVAFEHVEAAAIEREIAGVVHPERAQHGAFRRDSRRKLFPRRCAIAESAPAPIGSCGW